MKTGSMRTSAEKVPGSAAVRKRVSCSFTFERAEDCPDSSNHGRKSVCPFTLESCLETGIHVFRKRGSFLILSRSALGGFLTMPRVSCSRQ